MCSYWQIWKFPNNTVLCQNQYCCYSVIFIYQTSMEISQLRVAWGRNYFQLWHIFADTERLCGLYVTTLKLEPLRSDNCGWHKWAFVIIYMRIAIINNLPCRLQLNLVISSILQIVYYLHVDPDIILIRSFNDALFYLWA